MVSRSQKRGGLSRMSVGVRFALRFTVKPCYSDSNLWLRDHRVQLQLRNRRPTYSVVVSLSTGSDLWGAIFLASRCARVECVCEYCGRTFLVPASDKERRKHCSRQCADAAKTMRRTIVKV